MRAVRITYDPDGDILSITFGPPTAATGYQLSDQLLLRVDPLTQQAAGVTIFNFAVHAKRAAPLPLPGLDEDPEVKPTLLQLLRLPPVARFLPLIDGEHGVRATLLRPSLQEAVVA